MFGLGWRQSRLAICKAVAGSTEATLEKLERGVWFRESKDEADSVPFLVELTGDNSPAGLRCLSSRSLRLDADDQCPGEASAPALPRGASSPSAPDQDARDDLGPADPQLDIPVSMLTPLIAPRPCIFAGAETLSAFGPIDEFRSSARCLKAWRSGLPSLTRFFILPKTPPPLDLTGFVGGFLRLALDAVVRRAEDDCVPKDLVVLLSSRARSCEAAARSASTRSRSSARVGKACGEAGDSGDGVRGDVSPATRAVFPFLAPRFLLFDLAFCESGSSPPSSSGKVSDSVVGPDIVLLLSWPGETCDEFGSEKTP